MFHYGTFDSAFSHAFAFFLVCVWLLLVEQWWNRPTALRSIALGVVAAGNVLTRHTNAIYLLALPLYGVNRWDDVRRRFSEMGHRRHSLSVATVVGVIVALPQLALYKWTTGSWLVNAYATHDMSFSFGSPHVAAVLFSTQKGLFFWSPVLLLAIAGVFVARDWPRKFAATAVVVFALQTYLIASWPQWQFGASFGHRGFTDGFALAAPFIASTFEWLSTRRALLIPIAIAVALAVALSTAQMIQYWTGILPMMDTTWAQYQHVFLKFR